MRFGGLATILVALGAFGAGAAPTAAQAAGPACYASLRYSDARRGVSVLILKNGKPICEGYSAQGGPEAGFEIWSGTKSFWGIAVAAAVQDGLLSLDEPVAKTVTEWAADPVKSTVTLRQLLTLTSGLTSPPGRAMPFAEAVTWPFKAAPGEAFIYGASPYQVFGLVLQRKLAAAGRPSDPLSYLKARILDPIGLKPTDWRRAPNGDLLLPQGAVLTAREWVKFGEFVRARGVVGGKALVDPKTFDELFVGTKANPAYGVTWWLPRPSNTPLAPTAAVDLSLHASEVPSDMVVAGGAGDQRLYVVPSQGVTVVRQAYFTPQMVLAVRAEAKAGNKWSDAEFAKLALAAAAEVK